MIDIRTLGQFSVRLDGDPVVIKQRRTQSLLAFLALNAGKAYRREKLAGMLWPDATEANARNYLRHALWQLRKALETREDVNGVYFHADALTIAFDRAAGLGVDAQRLLRPLRGEVSTDELMADVSVYGGEFLPGFYEDWVILDRERLRVALDNKMQRLLDQLLVAERWHDVVEWGVRWIALGHSPEPGYRAIMIAQHGLGDRAGMAETYARCRQALEEEVGVEPSELTEATYLWLAEGAPRPAGLPEPENVPAPSFTAAAAQSLLSQWRLQDREILDVASLALIHRAGDDLVLRDEDAPLLIRSAIHADVDVDPWLERVSAPAVAVAALADSYRPGPLARFRRRIVDALAGLPGPEADEILLEIALSDDDPGVRETAAVEAAKRGHHELVARRLVDELNQQASKSSLAAFVAVVMDVGWPADMVPYPRLLVNATLAERCWRRHRRAVMRHATLAATGGSLMVLYGAAVPALFALFFPERYAGTLSYMTAGAYYVLMMVIFGLYGVIQGWLAGFFIAAADALRPVLRHRRWRALLGSVAGLYFALNFTAISLLNYNDPAVGTLIVLLANLLYGIVLGAILSLVIPELQTRRLRAAQLKRMALGTILAVVAVVPLAFAILPGDMSGLATRLMLALAIPLAVGVRFIPGREASPSTPTSVIHHEEEP